MVIFSRKKTLTLAYCFIELDWIQRRTKQLRLYEDFQLSWWMKTQCAPSGVISDTSDLTSKSPVNKAKSPVLLNFHTTQRTKMSSPDVTLF